MKKLLTKTIQVISVATLFVGLTGTANAGTTYYVYKKGSTSTCDISTKSPDKYKRGSKYQLVGSDSTRSGVKKQGQKMGCSSF